MYFAPCRVGPMKRVGFLVGLLVGFLVVDQCNVSAYSQYEDTGADDNDDVDFDDNYDSEDVSMMVTAPHTTARQRIRRLGEQRRGGRTLSADEVRDVKGALDELLAGRLLDPLTASYTSDITADETNLYGPSTKDPRFTGLTSIYSINPTKLYEEIIDELIDGAQRKGLILKGDQQETNDNDNKDSDGDQRKGLILKGDQQETNDNDSKDSANTDLYSPSALPQKTSVMTTTIKTNDDNLERLHGKGYTNRVGDKPEKLVVRDDDGDYEAEDEILKTLSSINTSTSIAKRQEALKKESTEVSRLTITLTRSTLKMPMREGTPATKLTTTNLTNLNALNQNNNTTTPKVNTTTEIEFDIPALVNIIANLTNDFESNLTQLFNNTLQRYNIPTCKTPEPTTTERVYYDLMNATVVAKCFVCGMTDPGIPVNAYCADAFAGDFLPLVPIDPQARGHISRFRKYCRYMDVNGYYENSTQPRSIYGRFTGGCAVRWVDLTGVYTQRTCRNTRHAMMGTHFGSKRMAKLEMALKEVDNGCIISPMASLLPLSRGISLYARFHACVCTGSWCNTSTNQQWIDYITILTVVVLTVT